MRSAVMPPFHLAFPVTDLEATRHFYVKVIGCQVGRQSDEWIDFDFFGHQISAHLKPAALNESQTNSVDGDAVPVRHFGVVLEWSQWETIANNLKSEGFRFRIEPKIRFQGQAGEQGTFFVDDPSGNALEFKTFRNMGNLFAKDS